MSPSSGYESAATLTAHRIDVDRARLAQMAWSAQPVRHRLRIIRRMRHAVAMNAGQLAQTVPPTLRRSPRDTLVSELLPLADACRFLERNSARLLAPQRLSPRHRPLWLHGVDIDLHREPFGVVLIIAPANYPLFLPGVQLLQALTAGNAVLLKPGVGGRPAALALADLLTQSGLDPNLLYVLSEVPDSAQAAIAAGVDKVVLTGSASTGEQLLTGLASHLTPATLELSGCDAALVHKTADLEIVTAALRFSLHLNHGATCIAPRRIIVDHTRFAELEHRLRFALAPLPAAPVSPDIYRHAEALVTEACQQGARQISGSFLPDDQMTPVVITDATPSMRLLQADVFAPILALVKVQDETEALAVARQCPYALGASVFGHPSAVSDWSRQLPAGVVTINDVIVPTADPRLPFGGRGRSGYGTTRGAAGLLDLTTLKAIAQRKGRWRPHYESPHETDSALFQAYITAAHAASWRDRFAAIATLVRTLISRTKQRPGGEVPVER